ncbi:hypothetical protein [Paenibacillus sp. FSL K6-2524]|uniref:hypothetical protein n=1 Tax=Paenibacillus sp. FSL K6-2524 TaxID=2954516 RepID=UPI0030F5110A
MKCYLSAQAVIAYQSTFAAVGEYTEMEITFGFCVFLSVGTTIHFRKNLSSTWRIHIG